MKQHSKIQTLENLPNIHFKNLGTAKDSKSFKYNYIPKYDLNAV